jgi:D-glycero-D-manno-heptose 1,7-bisphosphate phosphatase
MFVRQAVVLVGGKGARLGDLTRDRPKPMLEVSPGLLFLDVLLEELARRGFSDILLLAGHHGDQVEAQYQGRRVMEATVRVLREPEPQGTGGALRPAAAELDPWFLMANGDSLFEFNLRELAARPDDRFVGRLALRQVDDPARYGAVRLAGDVIEGFSEKDKSLKGPALINGGVYLLSRRVLERIHGPCSIERDVFPALAADGLLRGAAFDGYFLDIGLPDTYARAQRDLPERRNRPCAFLDRDGVLNHDGAGYTHKPEDLRWTQCAREAVKLLNDSGYLTVVVTNQAGVARGFYTEDHIGIFHAHMREELADIGAHIDAIYYCPFHAEGVVERYRAANHPDRKPNPGMILKAMADLPIRRAGSFLIGDNPGDLDAAAAAGLPSFLFKEDGDLLEAVQHMLSQHGG